VRLNQLFANMPGLSAYPSDANFILVRVAHAQKTFDALLARKILVKNTSTSHPLLANTLRITIGSPDENNALIEALNVIQGEALVTVRATP
jgi:histidinol-phosphate aminotransferase